MNVRQTLVGFIGGLTLAFAAERAAGYPVTWQFAGEITSVLDRNNLLDGAITVGTPFSGSYTFESTTPDVNPKNTGNGRYDDAITSVSGVIGDLTFGGPIKGDNLIAVRDDFLAGGFDNYLANTRVDFFGESMFFLLVLRDSTGSMLLDDSLPLSAPSLEGLDPTVTGFRISMKEDLGLFGDLTFLVPEPTTFLLMALGSLGVIGRRQRHSRIAPNGGGLRKARMRGPTLVGFIGGLTLAFAAERAMGYPVTWQFAGEITSVVDRNNLLDGAITVGTPFSGSYTFESSTPDGNLEAPWSGRYDDAITSVSGVVGDLTFGGPIKGDNFIGVLDDFPTGGFDNYLAISRIDFFGEPMFFSLALRDSTGGMFLDDSLPLSAPSLEGLDPTVTGFRISMKEDLGLSGDLTFLVPEPTTFLLMALGSFAVFGRRQRRSRAAPNGGGLRKAPMRAPSLVGFAFALCSLSAGPAEDWGPATAIVAANKSWGETRIIVPISDEGPRCEVATGDARS